MILRNDYLALFNIFFHSLQNFNFPANMARKCFLDRVPDDSADTLGVKNGFLHFYAENCKFNK